MVLGDDRSPHSTVMLSSGTGLRLHTNEFRAAMEHQPELRRVLLRYSLAFFNQAAHTALSNASSVIAKRIARWILITHDRVARNEIPLTHDVIATMLDVRRPGVTTALDELRVARLISLRRGCVVVLNRSGLQKLAGDFWDS